MEHISYWLHRIDGNDELHVTPHEYMALCRAIDDHELHHPETWGPPVVVPRREARVVVDWP